ncbi:MAG: twin-arginine translocation signal domain-containing protein, partial [Rhodobacterales bacterium]|nr:twin-arginine translocation signal domain-containing protein [Rhodobacterales bacterium]
MTRLHASGLTRRDFLAQTAAGASLIMLHPY